MNRIQVKDSKKIENHTIPEIKEKIEEIISTLPHKDLWENVYKHYLKVNGRVKANFIAFYNHVSDYCDQCDVDFEENNEECS